MPDWSREIRRRLAAARLSPDRETDIVEEVAQHLEDRYRAALALGRSPDDAKREAWRELEDGNILGRGVARAERLTPIAAVRVEARRRRAIAAAAWQDLRYSVRTLRRNPGFAAIAIIVLALGIGVNTAVFSVIDAVFLRALPVSSPEQVIYVYGVSAPIDVHLFRDRASTVLSGVTAHSSLREAFSAGGQDAQLSGELVTANYFDVLGVTPILGRTFRPEEDDVATTDPAVVISDDLWTHRFQRDPGVLGTHIRMSDKVFTVVGVVGPAFTGVSEPWNPSRYWITQAHYLAASPSVARYVVQYSWQLVARLRPGASVSQVRAIGPVPSGIKSADRNASYLVLPASDVLIPSQPKERAWPLRLAAYAIAGVVAIVLLIAAANLAGILMARGVSRTSELAVRQALGAGTSRLIRQLLTESVLLSAVGGLAGLAVAWLLVSLYRAYSPARYLVTVALDIRVLLFTAAVCLGAGLLVGLAPALQSLKVDVIAALGGGPAAGTTKRVRRRLRHGIVIPQVALSIVLLVVAGVQVRSLMHLELAGLGYRIDHRAVLQVSFWTDKSFWNDTIPPESQRLDRSQFFFQGVLERARAVPGITSASLSTGLPVYSRGGAAPRTYVSHDAFIAGATGTPVDTPGSAVSDGFFRTMGIPLLKGRDFDSRDSLASPHVAIISDSLARRLWPGRDAIGQSLALDPLTEAAAGHAVDQTRDWLDVIGIVSETQPVLHDIVERPSVYVPLRQATKSGAGAGFPLTLVASALGDERTIIRQLTQAIVGSDPSAQVPNAQTMTELVGAMLYPQRAAAWIMGGAGLTGLFLGVIGLYGVISYSVAQRLREIGIRSTLGAGPRDIIALVLREGATVAAIASVPGLILSYLALRLTSHLVGVMPTNDVLTFVIVPITMAAVILPACYLPARRAARVDPMVVLRGL